MSNPKPTEIENDYNIWHKYASGMYPKTDQGFVLMLQSHTLTKQSL